MVLDMARPKNRKSTIWLGMRGRDVARKSTLKVNIHRYSRSISQRSSLSWITTRIWMDRTRVQRVGWICTRRPCMSSHSRGTEKITRTMVSYFEQSRQNWAYETSIRFSSRCLDEKSSTPRIRRTSWRAYPSKSIQAMASVFKHIVVEEVWMELEMSSFLKFNRILFLTVGFVCNRWRSIVTDWNTSHVIFLMLFAHVMTLTSWFKVSQVRIRSFHMPSMMSHVWACVVCPRVVSFSLSLISTFSLTQSTCSLTSTSNSTKWSPLRAKTTAHTHIEEYCIVATYNPLTEWKKVRLRYCCNQVWMKHGGQVPWDATPLSAKHSRKSYMKCSLDTPCTQGGILKGNIMVTNIEELETMNASEI